MDCGDSLWISCRFIVDVLGFLEGSDDFWWTLVISVGPHWFLVGLGGLFMDVWWNSDGLQWFLDGLLVVLMIYCGLLGIMLDVVDFWWSVLDSAECCWIYN